MFRDVERTRIPILFTFFVADLVIAWVALNTTLLDPIIRPIEQATNGLINFTLLVSLLNLLLIAVLILWSGALRPRDIGIRWEQIAHGLGFLVAL